MNYEEIENRKKVSKEMEEKLLKTMKQKHLKRLSVVQYINDMQIRGLTGKRSLFVRFNEKF